MGKDNYEISIWRDTLVNGHYEETKIAIIGSNKFQASCRAVEPKLIENVNGTNTFTFKMYYKCRDITLQDVYTILADSNSQDLEDRNSLLLVFHQLEEVAADGYDNPFLQYLTNETKIKVKWKNQWYDLIIKNCQEDSSGKSITYTCSDAYINELSKNGFGLVFDNELGNNQGTAQELGAKILEGSDWTIDPNNQDIIQQEAEEAVYSVIVSQAVSCTKDTNGSAFTIPSGSTILLFYQQIIDLIDSGQNSGTKSFQMAYAPMYTTEVNGQVVTNAPSYTTTSSYAWTYSSSLQSFSITALGISISVYGAVSPTYRAKRLARTQKVVYDPITKRNCYVYSASGLSGHEIYQYTDTESIDAVAVVNLLANSSNFIDTNGWEGNYEIKSYPKLSSVTDLSTYNGKSYLKITRTTPNTNYNSGLKSCGSYLPDGLQKGTEYIFRYKSRTNADDEPSSTYAAGSSITIEIGTYTVDANNIKYFNTSIATVGTEVSESSDWYHRVVTFNSSYTRAEIYNQQIGIFIKLRDDLNVRWLEEAQFFKKIPTNDSLGFVLPGSFTTTTLANERYNYYDHTAQATLTDAKDIKFIYQGYTPYSGTSPVLTPVYNTNFEKIRSIEGKQSNRFNLLQSVAEEFNCWVRFRVEHNPVTGAIIYNQDGTPQKYVTFKKEIGEEVGIGFIYGIDLKSIQRTIESTNIVTKTIVSPNNNEFATNGSCNIARAASNYSKSNNIYNLDYYINKGLLDGAAVTQDLYNKGEGYLGYYSNLHDYYTSYDNNSQALIKLEEEKLKLNSYKTIFEDTITSANELITSYKAQICSLAGLSESSSLSDATEYIKNHANADQVKVLVESWRSTEATAANASAELASCTLRLASIEVSIASIKSALDATMTLIENLELAFNTKYARFIQEGTWQSDDYIDDNLYYIDALSLAYRSARPQISYNISVLRLSGLEDFKNKVFHLGDITYIQDKEFFGTTLINNVETPIKEKVLVSEITSNFDEPDKDSFKVQNYKTAFDDLFQRVTAATQSLQFAEGEYARAADAITSDGSIKAEVLQNAFDSNKELVMSATNDTVVQDSNGLTLSSVEDASRKVRINSNGIFISTDGGATWKNAVRGSGVATEALTAGSINTNKILMYQGNAPTFRWDFNGISAYNFTENQGVVTPTFGKFVRYDRFGLYGMDGASDWSPTTEAQIWNSTNARFGLTWKGFFLRNSTTNGKIEISTEKDILITDSNNYERVRIGRLTDGSTALYGIRIKDNSNNTVLETDNNGNLSITGQVTAKTGYIGNGTTGFTIGSNYIRNGTTSIDDTTNDGIYIGTDGIRLGPNFKVTKNGVVEAKTLKLINTVTIRYAKNSSATTPPSTESDWKTNMATVNPQAGDFVWTRTVTTYVNSASFPNETSYQVSRIGQDGTSVSIKGNVATVADLPTTGVHDGDGYVVETDTTRTPTEHGVLYTYNETAGTWTYCGQIKGQDGRISLILYLYQRSSSGAPSKPSSTLTYTFENDTLSGALGNWSRTIPASNGYPCYVTQAFISELSTVASVSLTSSDWSDTRIYTQDGAKGDANYVLEISNAFVFPPATYEGATSWTTSEWQTNTVHKVTAYYGGSKINIAGYKTSSQTIPTSGVYVKYKIAQTSSRDTVTGWTGSITSGELSAYISGFGTTASGVTTTFDTGKVDYELYVNGTLVATDKFEVSKNKAGERGEEAPPYYLVRSSVATIGKNNDGTFKEEQIQFLCNKDGAPLPSGESVKYKIWQDGDASHYYESTANSVTMLYGSGYGSITSFSPIASVSVEIYVGNVKVDAELIQVTLDGADGTSVSIKGSVATKGNLPTSGVNDGDGYIVETDTSRTPTEYGVLYVYNATTSSWTYCGQIKGQDGVNTAVVFLYQRTTTSSPPKPTGTLTYTFASGELTATSSSHFQNWTPTIPNTSRNPCYKIQATAISKGATDDIGTSEWSDVELFLQDGENGQPGYNTAQVYLYKRSDTAPSIDWTGNLTYTFSTHSLATTPSGWLTSVPTDTRKPVYMTAAVASSRSDTDEIAPNEWAEPIKLVEDGDDGAPGNSTESITVYYTTAINPSSGRPANPTGAPQTTAVVDQWTTVPYATTSTYLYQYRSIGTKTTIVSPASTSYSYGEVVLYAIYNQSANYALQYDAFLKLTQNGAIETIARSNNGNLYINASYINTGILQVGDYNAQGGSTGRFLADIGSENVRIGEFYVNNSAIYNKRSYNAGGTMYDFYMTAPDAINSTSLYGGWISAKDYVYVGPDGVGVLTLSATITEPTTIEKQTYMKAGELFSNAGTIGGFTISSSSISSIDGSAHEVYIGIDKIRLGISSGGVYPFSVTNDGTLTVRKGTIGGWTVDTTKICTQGSGQSTGTGIYSGSGWQVYTENNHGYRIGQSAETSDIYYNEVAHSSVRYFAGTGQDIRGGAFKITENGYLFANHLNVGLNVTIDTVDDELGVGAIIAGGDPVNGICSLRFNTTLGHANSFIFTGGDLRINANIKTKSSSSTAPMYSIGENFLDSRRFNNIYCVACNQSSSKLIKENIDDFNDKHDIFFDNIQPRIFKYTYQSSDRIHYGFILEEIEEAFVKAGLTNEEVGLYKLSDKNDKESGGSLTYSEFISLNTWQIQLLKQRITSLEERLAKLEH